MTILQEIQRYFRENINEINLTEDSKLSDLHLDSLDRVELVMALEDIFKITITDEEAEKTETIKDIIKLIERKKNG